MKNLKKNAKGYGYNYTDLAEINKYLESVNCDYIQRIAVQDGNDYVETLRCIDGEWEKEWVRGSRVIQATLSGKNNPAQEQGSGLTYARRYSLLMAFGLATTDDDGQIFDEPEVISKKISKSLAMSIQKAFENKGYGDAYKVPILGKYGYKSFEDIETNRYADIMKEIEK